MVGIRFGGKKSISERFGRVPLLADLLLCTKPLITRTNLSDRRVFLPFLIPGPVVDTLSRGFVRKENRFLGRGNGKTHFIVCNQPFHSWKSVVQRVYPSVPFFFSASVY